MGFDLADDAGVVRLDDTTALIQTLDFFAPVVDDPWSFGAIAAANALSDVYAMGGRPLCAMNILCMPAKGIPEEVIAGILRGGLDKVLEAGACLVGGHSVKDDEMKFGLSVTGLVHPDQVWANRGARPGDALVLTKPIGTGVLTTARKRSAIPESALAEAIEQMARLNHDAADVARAFDVHAATDITGNGLAGHAYEIARASGAALRIRFADVPVLDGAREAVQSGHVPGGATSNERYIGQSLISHVSDVDRILAVDPQTSGGLLLAVPSDQADALTRGLRARGVPGKIVGEVTRGEMKVEFV